MPGNRLHRSEARNGKNRGGCPLTFYLDGKRRQVWNRTAFLRYHDCLFTPGFVGDVREGIPHIMSANWQGLMVNHGAVWFNAEGKAFLLNN